MGRVFFAWLLVSCAAVACGQGAGVSTDPLTGTGDAGYGSLGEAGRACQTNADCPAGEACRLVREGEVQEQVCVPQAVVDASLADAADAQPDDAAPADSGSPDTEPQDTGLPDTEPQDTGLPDTGAPDTEPADTGPSMDAADTSAPDTAATDTGAPPDTGVADTGSDDTGSPDTGPPDTGQARDSAPTTCTAQLTVTITSSGPATTCSFNSMVATGTTATLMYPCAGGTAMVTLGDQVFSGTVSASGAVSLTNVSMYSQLSLPPLKITCSFTGTQTVTGTIASGSLSYDYAEAFSTGDMPICPSLFETCWEKGTVAIP
jgi:hypothetical protein